VTEQAVNRLHAWCAHETQDEQHNHLVALDQTSRNRPVQLAEPTPYSTGQGVQQRPTPLKPDPGGG
jgi:hypothetical protein